MLLRALRAACLILAAAVTLAGCSATTSPLTRAQLRNDPASSLTFPGADPISQHEGDEYRMTVDGPRWADDTSVFRTREDASTVAAFYRDHLVESGWQSYHAFLTTEESDATAWCNGPMAFRVAIARPASGAYGKYLENGFRSVFIVTIAGRDPKIPCPYR